jgi:hypothetical protein|eukprot:COSAG06_NODE_11587_length_1488_cov_1.462203_2_plen_75_part_00
MPPRMQPAGPLAAAEGADAFTDSGCTDPPATQMHSLLTQLLYAQKRPAGQPSCPAAAPMQVIVALYVMRPQTPG